MSYRFSSFFSLVAVILLLCLPSRAAAQGQGDGTIYSRYGFGMLQEFSSSQIEAMGGGGTALRSLNYINFRNPASWSYQELTRAVAGARVQRLAATDATDRTSNLTSGTLTTAQFSFPILRRKLGVGLALKPYARTNYRVLMDDQELTRTASSDTALYEVNFEGRGGLQQVVGGLGYRLTDQLSVGANVHFVFGTYEDGRRIEFQTPGFSSTNLTRSTRLSGVTGTLGALYSLDQIAGASDRLTLGAAFTLPARLYGEQVLTLGESLNRDTLNTGGQTALDADITVPWRARAGAAYQANERWLFVANGVFEPWSQFDPAFSESQSFRGGVPQEYSDRVRLSGGLELFPAGDSRTASYLARTAYRLGGYYNQAYAHPQENDIRTLALTGGVSLPTQFPGTRLDLNMEVGTRGTTQDGLVRDVFYGFSLNVNFGERWFQERKLQ